MINSAAKILRRYYFMLVYVMHRLFDELGQAKSQSEDTGYGGRVSLVWRKALRSGGRRLQKRSGQVERFAVRQRLGAWPPGQCLSQLLNQSAK